MKKFLKFTFPILLLTAVTVNTKAQMSFNDSLLYFINVYRTSPELFLKEFALPYKSNYKEGYIEINGQYYISTEGLTAYNEFIEELKKQKPVGKLVYSKNIEKAAKELAKHQYQTGSTGHNNVNGVSMKKRILKYEKNATYMAENIAYGFNEPLHILMQLLIDDSVLDRGHRINLKNKDFNQIGFGLDYHRKFDYVLVMNFAFVE